MTALLLALISIGMSCQSGNAKEKVKKSVHSPADSSFRVSVGAEQLIESEMALLKGKRVAIVANHTSILSNNTHLVDTLKALGVDIRKIFSPEHGFRGDHGAGETVTSTKDEKTGIPLVSLYGKIKKPNAEMLADVDVVIFDIQDVGARFYTYISTMSYVMEACAELNKLFIVLDRPNPNGWYVEGPVLDEKFKSFVGLHPVPIVYGMTMGEYAKMVNQEGWLSGSNKCTLAVIPCKGYTHSMTWEQTGLKWIPPSPNLATEYSAYLYPILCWYEGMPVSLGRGTDMAFTIVGAPWHKGYANMIGLDSALNDGQKGRMDLFGLGSEYITFTPRSIPEKAPHPTFENQLCYGAKILNRVDGKNLFLAGLTLLLNFVDESKTVGLKEPIFQPYFNTLAGNENLQLQAKTQAPAMQIWATWQPEINRFKGIRKKYLLYPDFY